MARPARKVDLTPETRNELKKIIKSGTQNSGIHMRAKIILQCVDGWKIELVKHIKLFVEDYNKFAHPFEWRKREVKGQLASPTTPGTAPIEYLAGILVDKAI